MLILKECIEFNPFAIPICVDYELDKDDLFVSPGLRGLVGAWGRNESSVKPVELSVISREKCQSETSEEFLMFLTPDQFCAEYILPGLELCQSDSGGGLSFPITKNGETKYFLRGVASIDLINIACDLRQYLKFTNVIIHKSFVSPLDIKWRPVHTLTHTDSMAAVTSFTHCDITGIQTHGYITDLGDSVMQLAIVCRIATAATTTTP